jgi:N-methylhydantoinase A
VRAATDVGGTFTDLVYVVEEPGSAERRVVSAKVDTTPQGFERGVLDVLASSGIDVGEIDFLAHGTTVVINALTERKGVVTGLVTTEGFRDSLEIARGNRPDFFNLHYVKPPPFVPRRLRREVPGRLAVDGSERRPLDLSGLAGILEDFRREGVEAVAICLLHSYANPTHERQVLERIRELWPEVAAVASHQITRTWREYERTSTAVLSAYVQPVAERYLSRLADVAGNGLHIMKSNGGIDSAERARQIPITMVESGPASGVLAAAELGRVIGEPNVLALDIGGTTAKCSLIEDGNVRIVSDYWIERTRESAGYPILVPVVDLVEIGNGGGSIAWADEFGRLHVGPQSAGAVPGPAAYGLGGADPTTTDAHLALGRINGEYFRGGGAPADMAAVAEAFRRLAAHLGCDAAAAARSVVRIANENMVNALKLVSVNRGHDPRDFILVAFGGGGGLHAVELAEELAIGRVVVPYAADVFSAWGMLLSDLRRDHFVTRVLPFDTRNVARVNDLLDDVEREALEGLAATASVSRHARLRYENQEHGVEVPLRAGPLEARTVQEVSDAFHELYEREYTYRLRAPVELVGVHVVATEPVGRLAPVPLRVTGRPVGDSLKGRRLVDFAAAGTHEATVVDGDLLEPGMSISGPAVVEQRGTTILLRPSDELVVDLYGNSVITL